MGTEFIEEADVKVALYNWRRQVADEKPMHDPVFNGRGELYLKRGVYRPHMAFIGINAGNDHVHAFLTPKQVKKLIQSLQAMFNQDYCVYNTEWPADEEDDGDYWATGKNSIFYDWDEEE